MKDERDYPKRILPTLKKMQVGETIPFWGMRTLVIRSSINNMKLSSLKRFSTVTEGCELRVTREKDEEKNYDIPKINSRKTTRNSY